MLITAELKQFFQFVFLHLRESSEETGLRQMHLYALQIAFIYCIFFTL